jgi:hypothetical protein
MSKAKAKKSTRSVLKKEVDSWIAEDYPMLGALKHPYRSTFLVLTGIAVAAFVAALSDNSIGGALVVIILFVPAAYFHISKR